MTQKTIRVMIVDDHAIVRKGIRALLATERDIQVIGEASDGAEAVAPGTSQGLLRLGPCIQT